MISFPLKLVEPTTIRLRRVFVVVVALCALAVAIYRASAWLQTWNIAMVGAAIAAAAALTALAIWIAVHGSARVVKRVVLEMVFFGCAVLAAEAVLFASSPETWSDDPLAQRVAARERAARARGIEFDGRLRADVVRDLEARGLDGVPGLAQGMAFDPTLAAAIGERGLVPLSNLSNAYVVECNEGLGYFEFRSDEHGFNNPPGLTSGPVAIAVVGESLALGHCVPPGKSAVDLIRQQYPRTANFAVAGSRVLSHLGTFREYVEPLQPSTVLWFVNLNFADPKEEADQPVLRRYLEDPSFSQDLLHRQDEVDAIVRDIVAPAILKGDDSLRHELEKPAPLERLIKLREVRSLLDFAPARRQSNSPIDLARFESAIQLAARTARSWGGRLIVVVLPNYGLTMGQRIAGARYDAVMNVLNGSALQVVDGAALFAAQPDVRSLYTLRIDNHPSEKGHALLAEAILAAIRHREGN
jgi:hypothetical protein